MIVGIMSKNYFILQSSQDLDKAYRGIILWFKGKFYEVEATKKDDIYLIQARKTGKVRTLLGANLAFHVKIYKTTDGLTNYPELIIETTRGKWVQNFLGAGFASFFTASLTIWTGIASASWGWWLENELTIYLEKDLNFQRIKPDATPDSEINVENNNVSYTNTINLEKSPSQQQMIAELEEEITKLEKAFTDDVLTEEEFSRKKSAIEQKIDDYEVSFVIDDKIIKLQSAFSQGIIDQIEYEEKLNYLETKVKQQILQQKSLERNKTKIIKLKEALKNGVITQTEFDRKISQLS